MRQIKFRGKSSSGKWTYGYILTWINGDTDIIVTKSAISCDKISVDPDTVGQFTGLLDKNGKEIYEGDILVNGGTNYIVCWNDISGAWWLKYKDLIYFQQLGAISTKFFIMGSIYDNLKLLKGGEK